MIDPRYARPLYCLPCTPIKVLLTDSDCGRILRIAICEIILAAATVNHG